MNWTPATPMLSRGRGRHRHVALTLAAAGRRVTDTVGAVVSLTTVTLTPADVVVLPAASRATAVSV